MTSLDTVLGGQWEPLEKTLSRLETAIQRAASLDWQQVRSELASAVARAGEQSIPDALRLRVWRLALEWPQSHGTALVQPAEDLTHEASAAETPAATLTEAQESIEERFAPSDVNTLSIALVGETAGNGADLIDSPTDAHRFDTLWTDTVVAGESRTKASETPATRKIDAPYAAVDESESTARGASSDTAREAAPGKGPVSAGMPSTLENDVYDVLEQDVLRTRRGTTVFDRAAARTLLTQWLCTFCETHGVPYMQGMNEVAAVFVYLHETQHSPVADCTCYALYERFEERFVPLTADLGPDPFRCLKLAFELLTALLWFHDPELAVRLERYQLTPDMFSTSWLVTVFARNLSLDAVLALWDALVLAGDPLLTIFVALVCLESNRQSLLMASEASLPEQLLSIPLRSRQDIEAAWQWARKLESRTPAEALRRSRNVMFGPSPVPAEGTAFREVTIVVAFEPHEVIASLEKPCNDGTRAPLPALLLDCRPSDERQYGYLPEAIPLDLDELRDAVVHGWEPCLDRFREDVFAQRIVQHVLERFGASHDGKIWICLVGSGPPTYFDVDENAFDVLPLKRILEYQGVHYVASLRHGFAACEALAKRGSLALAHYDAAALAQARQAKCARFAGVRPPGPVAPPHVTSRIAPPGSHPEECLDRQVSQTLGMVSLQAIDSTLLGTSALHGWLDGTQLMLAKHTPLDIGSPALLRRLTLYPCLKLQRKSGVFVNRYLGITRCRFFVLAPDRARNTLMYVKSSRHLLLLKRILFRKESRELVIFEFRAPDSQLIDKRITCHLADGLSDCVESIRRRLRQLRLESRLGSRAARDTAT